MTKNLLESGRTKQAEFEIFAFQNMARGTKGLWEKANFQNRLEEEEEEEEEEAHINF